MAAGAPPCTRGCRSLKSARRASFQGVQVPQDVFGPTVVDELLTTTACAGVNTSERVRSCAMMWGHFPWDACWRRALFMVVAMDARNVC